MSPRMTSLELALVAIVFAAGFGLRAAYPSRMAVEHFDEGVYASNLYTPEGRYPFQHLYAPPLVPFCLEWAAILGGPGGVMAVNVLSGSLTLLVLWGMVRAWWGPPAAIAAMVLLAFNEFHIAYSRAALTDAMLGLWMTAGVWAGWRAIQFGGLRNIAAAGVLASLAWWTKYNGWLTLAITGSGTAGWILFGDAASRQRQRPENPPPLETARRKSAPRSARGPAVEQDREPIRRGADARLYLGRWLMTAVIAFLLWTPWLWELQQYGGYAAVAKNHAGYFTGPGQWWGNAVRQVRAFVYTFDLYSSYGWVLFCLLPVAAFPRCVKSYGKAAVNGGSDRPDSWWRRAANSGLGAWMLTAWVTGLLVAIPLYAPYPRLMVPLLPGLAALAAAACFRRQDLKSAGADVEVPLTEAELKSMRRLRVGIGVWLACMILPPWALADMRTWKPRTGLAEISRQTITRLQSEELSRDIDGVRCAVYVVAEPGLYFHLAAAQGKSPIGHVAVPAADFNMAAPGASASGLPAYILIGPHADHAEADRLIAAGRLEPVAEFEYRPSDLVLLDSRPAWDLPPKDKPVIERIRLLQVKP